MLHCEYTSFSTFAGHDAYSPLCGMMNASPLMFAPQYGEEDDICGKGPFKAKDDRWSERRREQCSIAGRVNPVDMETAYTYGTLQAMSFDENE